jgi:hypothetical protein
MIRVFACSLMLCLSAAVLVQDQSRFKLAARWVFVPVGDLSGRVHKLHRFLQRIVAKRLTFGWGSATLRAANGMLALDLLQILFIAATARCE